MGKCSQIQGKWSSFGGEGDLTLSIGLEVGLLNTLSNPPKNLGMGQTRPTFWRLVTPIQLLENQTDVRRSRIDLAHCS